MQILHKHLPFGLSAMKYLGAEVPKCDSSEDQPKEKERNPEDFGAKNFQLKNGTHSRERERHSREPSFPGSDDDRLSLSFSLILEILLIERRQQEVFVYLLSGANRKHVYIPLDL